MVNFSRKHVIINFNILYVWKDIVSVFKVQLETAYSREFQKVVKLNFL